MNNVIDLAKERRVSALLREIVGLSGGNPEVTDRTLSMLKGKAMDIPTSIRLPEPLVIRLDALAVRFNADSVKGLERTFKRSDILRLALIRGIEELEAELKK